jgi:hypothetical protein
MKSQMKSQKFLGLLLIFFLSGCSGYRITYNTQPMGAAVICNGINEGYSPVRKNVHLTDEIKQRGFVFTVPCRAIWSSGVTKDFGNTWDLNEFPNGVMQTLQRPSGEGYSQDAEFALKIQNMKSQRRAAEAAEDAAEAAEDAAKAAKDAAYQLSQPVSCFSYAGITTCN